MKKIEITINGRHYPCRVTMGAMLLFKRETGREATELDGGALSDLITFVWCCAKSASRAEGVDFQLSLDEFADSISAEDAGEVFRSLNPEESGDGSQETGGGKKKK